MAISFAVDRFIEKPRHSSAHHGGGFELHAALVIPAFVAAPVLRRPPSA